MSYREHLFMAVGCMLDKGLELSRHAKSGEGVDGGALEAGDILEEWESEIAMPRNDKCVGSYQKSLS